eukprot:3664374-Pyramimonas_sp.AAC.1
MVVRGMKARRVRWKEGDARGTGAWRTYELYKCRVCMFLVDPGVLCSHQQAHVAVAFAHIAWDPEYLLLPFHAGYVPFNPYGFPLPSHHWLRNRKYLQQDGYCRDPLCPHTASS